MRIFLALLFVLLVMFPALGTDLAQVAQAAKSFSRCMVPLEKPVLFGLLGKTFVGAGVLIVRVQVHNETYDLWTIPADLYHSVQDLQAEVKGAIGVSPLAIIKYAPLSLIYKTEAIAAPALVITPPTAYTPLATLCPLSQSASNLESKEAVIVGLSQKDGKIAHFVSFGKLGWGYTTSYGYHGGLRWEHKREDVAGSLILTWKDEGKSTQDFLPIGTYGPWEEEWEQNGRMCNNKWDIEPMLPAAMRVLSSQLPKGRALNIVRAAFGLELKPEPGNNLSLSGRSQAV